MPRQILADEAVRLERSCGTHHIVVVALPVGQDLVVTIYGGDQAHIGATALAQPRPSLNDAKKISASTSVLCVLGHKEDLLAHHIAQYLAASLNCVVSVNCGIHIEDASPEQLALVPEVVEQMAQQLVGQLKRTSSTNVG